MRVIGLSLLSDFCNTHADCRKWISNWILDAKEANWDCTHSLKARYPTASFLAENVVIFNVRGNEYRMVTQIAFSVRVVAIKWIGTHAEYSKRYR